MKAIIAGGRNYTLHYEYLIWLDKIHVIKPITEVISGGASGADEGGELWAKSRNIPISVFKADWSLGPGGGPIRNRQMAEHARPKKGEYSLCILFPGGRGTANMKMNAKKAGLVVIEYTALA